LAELIWMFRQDFCTYTEMSKPSVGLKNQLGSNPERNWKSL